MLIFFLIIFFFTLSTQQRPIRPFSTTSSNNSSSRRHRRNNTPTQLLPRLHPHHPPLRLLLFLPHDPLHLLPLLQCMDINETLRGPFIHPRVLRQRRRTREHES
ncbi:hypothetical protein M413DRAFT_267748 [Hebeloma cylindrosporum]|uniref:Secreted protein n=1 Tax=Hebeloma cylindrosporum TaxID=76867 RepID=A0A0C3CE00_HEBCY|nr:hypothetical protein M413DRAFT_267748 [Hebeloma cylindrosporum h7]